MVPLLLVYGLFNAICVAILVLVANNAPLVEDDPLPTAVLAHPVNDNDDARAREAPMTTATATVPRLRPMHLVA